MFRNALVQHCPPVVFTKHCSRFITSLPVFLIPSSVSLSKTVTQSLPRSLSLSVCQSAVSRSLIQSVLRLLSLSLSRSLTHSFPLSLFAHLTSLSLAHLHSPPIHHRAHLSCQVFFFSFSCQRPRQVSLSLHLLNFSASQSSSCFVLFCWTSFQLPVLQNLFFSELFHSASSNPFSFCHSSLVLLCFVPPSTLLTLFCLSSLISAFPSCPRS